MYKNNILSTFQKHIGVVEGMPDLVDAQTPRQTTPLSTLHIHRFTEDMKGANEFIGTLQSATSALKKILKLAQSVDSEYAQPIEISQTKGEIKEITQSSCFMGVPLFDTEFSTKLNGESFHLIIDNPMPLADKDLSSLVGYTEEKINEITQTLLQISDALTQPTFSPRNPTMPEYNFDECDKQNFTQLFKGK
ncbi:hypothetical protein LS68_000795 [Helicobacter sp. MIT 05-5293]|uniref:flagellar FLiS export co-chaperone n=1 Tax=Helicobacter sp. MIT 05-5293 TaxID=1548149 RepID=UPI00068CD2A0|nr:flagellar FLiS export co-chaperone [Helicobacter sp. MIT 05-5293]TLD81604.1 hypothetical protein LS68_000795 [Helicobacter sp. MIT 05-5293]